MTGRSIGLSEELHTYLVAHGTPPDEVLTELAEDTARRFPDQQSMQIAAEQGAFLHLLVQVVGARRAVEVGTFTGYSAICIARALAPGGRLLCCDVSEEWTAVARRYWQQAGVADRIDLRLGDARQTLAALPADEPIDFAFIDADKTGYATYYEQLLTRLAPDGVICVDNVLWSGRVVDEAADDTDTRAIRAFNDLVAADERVEAVMLPVADGLTLIRRR
jgi:caffeoyl-CoA O-methyltransferase